MSKKKKNEQTNPFNPDYFSYTDDFPAEEVWNTDNVLAQLIVPRLLAFRNLDKHGCPGDFKDMRSWNNAIQKMVDAFELMKYAGATHTEDEERTIASGLEIFCKYFRHLWD